ncbi:RdgB/HAM1 family non-canonical purine NTP pyrophosphatase [Tumidithrix elongata RA019]|uniref:dITP/XTP pyrophosphatase n=1 Tax=Tumidithrix elongata BACA0141 TaxID=2716417 RepID=A0AAW9Q6K2_9CYAN|nr:RdgB/HAM1 family non-canonical purine NTP pyrophosphatase [Tumidithrix elongata RA019]
MTIKATTLKKLVIASGNHGKVAEFREYLADLGFELLPKPDELDVEETGETFLANAHLKASQVAIATGEWALADDSGLEVMALGGAPGVFSARYGSSDRDRINRILQELDDNPNREAQFVCAIAVATPDGNIIAEAIGVCKGEILHVPQGDNGFGYDPIFFVPEQGKSFGEMPSYIKAQISHRAIALNILRPKLKDLQLAIQH